MSRTLSEKFKAQHERLKYDATLDDLERELNLLIKENGDNYVTA